MSNQNMHEFKWIPKQRQFSFYVEGYNHHHTSGIHQPFETPQQMAVLLQGHLREIFQARSQEPRGHWYKTGDGSLRQLSRRFKERKEITAACFASLSASNEFWSWWGWMDCHLFRSSIHSPHVVGPGSFLSSNSFHHLVATGPSFSSSSFTMALSR